jgi:FAD/FMN-containing dehydrogenase
LTAHDMEARLLAALRRIVGPNNVLTEPDMTASYLTEPRGLFAGRALCVVRPHSTAEVSEVVEACATAQVAIVPQGGNTGLVGGQIPDDSGRQVVLSLQRMKRIREIDPLTDTMTVEAGLTLLEAQEAAEGADRLFPLSLASEGACTIGGNLASNAGGTAVLAFGNARELTVGVEAVLADGRIVNALSKLRKDNTGYDLKDLFVGSEGTLAIITAAALKLFPKPRSRVTAFIGLPDPHKALALFRLAREKLGQGVVSFELMKRIALEFVLKHGEGARDPLAEAHPWYVLMEVAAQVEGGLDEAVEAVLAEGLERELLTDAALAATLEQRLDFWRLRELVSETQKFEGGSIKHDISVPVGVLPEFLASATAAVEAFLAGARVVPFGHMGDGNLHFNVSQPVGADKAAFLALWEPMNDVVHKIVAEMQGSFSAEHGIGRLKRDLLAKAKDPVTLDVMRRIKAALDPNGLLNPGKML